MSQNKINSFHKIAKKSRLDRKKKKRQKKRRKSKIKDLTNKTNFVQQCKVTFIFVFIKRFKQEKTFIIRKLLIDMHNLRMESNIQVN